MINEEACAQMRIVIETGTANSEGVQREWTLCTATFIVKDNK